MIQDKARGGRERRVLHKEPVISGLSRPDRSALAKYQEFFIGTPGFLALLRFELVVMIAGARSGAAGYLLRKALYPKVFGSVGSGVQFGRNISLRHPCRIRIGDRSAIDDECLLDARGGGEEGIRIGEDVLIARATIVQCKSGPISIGDGCSIGSHCLLSSAGGIRIGRHVLVAGKCYIGGGRYRVDLTGTPMMHQDLYSQGPVVIGEDVWLGAGVTVLDGVKIGAGAVIGAGATIRKDVPDNTMVIPEGEFSYRQRPVPPEMKQVFTQLREDSERDRPGDGPGERAFGRESGGVAGRASPPTTPAAHEEAAS
jgi:acetyltransferase-like isoleucine patch superfamily enzyme